MTDIKPSDAEAVLMGGRPLEPDPPFGPPLSRADRRALAPRLESLLAEIGAARLPSLREIWRRELRQAGPGLRSPELYRRMLAHRIQEAALGGMSGLLKGKLADMEERRLRGDGPPPPALRLAPGTILVREWQGRRHEVQVSQNGFLHQGKCYGSLSEAARAIAGTRWNGPRFFGLREPG